MTIELKDGGVYRTREGEEVKLTFIKEPKNTDYVFVGSNLHFYLKNGLRYHKEESCFDLIEEISVPREKNDTLIFLEKRLKRTNMELNSIKRLQPVKVREKAHTKINTRKKEIMFIIKYLKKEARK